LGSGVLRVFAAAAVLCAAAGASRVNAAAAPSRRNVVLIILESVRSDHVGAYGYSRDTTPNMDALAREGVLFKRHFCNSTWTPPSVATLLTGQFMDTHGITGYSDNVWERSRRRIFEFLSAKGYRVSHRRVEQAPDSKDPVPELLGWMQEDERRPFFLVVQLLDSHVPYRCPKQFQERFAPKQSDILDQKEKELSLHDYLLWLVESRVHGDTPVLRHMIAHYDGSIAYVDDQIGRLRAGMEAHDLLGSTHLIIVGDHGESLDEAGRFLTHGDGSFCESMLRVPLIWRPPGGCTGRTLDFFSGHTDVLPTLFAWLGIPAPDWFQGKDLSAWMRGERKDVPEYWIYGSEVHVGKWIWMFRDRKWKCVFNAMQSKAFLYDLEQDPQETKNLVKSKPELVFALAAKVLEKRQALIRAR
jgi:arylsulfatase A-like enzyme